MRPGCSLFRFHKIKLYKNSTYFLSLATHHIKIFMFMTVGLVQRHSRIIFTDCPKLRIEVASDGKMSRIDFMKIGQLVRKLN